MADDTSLLFRIRGDASSGKAAIAETRAAVAQLRQSIGPQLTQAVGTAYKSFGDLDHRLNEFVGEHVPLVGRAFVQISDKLRAFGGEGGRSEKAIEGVAKSIQAIATESGKTIPQISGFLTKFVQLEGQAKRDSAAVDFFGASLGAKLLPQLEETGTALAGVTEESAGLGAAFTGVAGSIGIAVIAIGAFVAVGALVGEQLFEMSKRAAEFRGRMVDLSQQTGLAVETLSALEVASKLTGGELGSITQAVFLFQRKLDDAQDPLSKTAEQFRKFNISTADTENSLRQTFAALAAMPEGFAQTNAAAEFFGARGGKQVLAILKETNGNLDKTINELRELGILISDSDARAAKKFNDELTLLDFQLRALSATAVDDLIPTFAEAVKTTRDLVVAIRPLASVVGTILGPEVRATVATFKLLSIALANITRDYRTLAEAAKEAKESISISPINVPSVTPAPLPGPPSPQQAVSDAVNQSEEILAAVKRNAAQANQALSELFQKGRRDREQETQGIIAENKKVLEAEQARIDALINQKKQEIKDLDEAQRNRGEIVNRDAPQYRAASAELVKLFQQRQDKENEFEVASKALRAKAAKERADSTRNQIANDTEILTGGLDRQITAIEVTIKRGAALDQASLTSIELLERAKIDARIEGLRKQKEVGLLSVKDQKEIDDKLEQARIERLDLEEDQSVRRIEQLEQAKLDARIRALKNQKAVGQLTIQEQKDLDNEIRKLTQDRDRLTDAQAEAKIERERARAQRSIEIAQGNLDTLIQLEQSAGERRIASIQAQAERRIITEEEAAKQILKIRLDLIDDEIEATSAKLKAAASIGDKNERIKAQADLNNQIKILTDQRVTIQAEGNRDIEEKRQKDIENERHYVEAIVRLRQRSADAQRDLAQAAIELMGLSFARRRDIIRAQAQADTDEENRRNRQARDEIASLRHDVAESNRTREEKLQAQLEIDDLEETEAERHRLVLEEIRRRARLDEKNAEPLGRLNLDLDNLKEFARIVEDSIVPLGQILTNTFQQVADAISQTVQNWVLLGETGPAVMRKILAQALASIAAEAAVNAIKELALGFATLFFNPAESAAHFTSAALWGSIAGVAAVAGRSVAGDLFKQKSSGVGGSGGSGQSGPGQLNTITLARNQPEPQRVIVIQLKGDDSKLGSFITAHVVKDINTAGPIRETLANDGNP